MKSGLVTLIIIIVGIVSNSFALLHNNQQKKRPDSSSDKFAISTKTIFQVVGGVIVSMAAASYFFSSSPKIFETANDIPAEYFKEKREIKAIVVKITDGDTYRVRHVTSSHPSAEFTGKLSDNTIAVRIAAVDTPEIAKFGNAGQEFGNAAKDFASKLLLGKRVTVKLLSKDQYGRVVGTVQYRDNTILPNFLCNRKDISEQLLQQGLAVVYRQGGGQYDGSITRWNDIEEKAIRSKRGLWMNGKKNAELPSDYKKAVKQKDKARSFVGVQ